MNVHLAYQRFKRLNPNAKENAMDNFPEFVHFVGLGLWISAIGDALMVYFDVEDARKLIFVQGAMLCHCFAKFLNFHAMKQRKILLKNAKGVDLISFPRILICMVAGVVFYRFSGDWILSALIVADFYISISLLVQTLHIKSEIPSLFYAVLCISTYHILLVLSLLTAYNFYTSATLAFYFIGQFLLCSSTLNFDRDKLY